MLKKYELGNDRKTAKIFTPEEVLLGLQAAKMSLEWVLWRCGIALSSGGRALLP